MKSFFSKENDLIAFPLDARAMPGLDIAMRKIKGSEDILVIYLKGYLDSYNSSIFVQLITSHIDKGYRRLIFQCNKLNYITSSGIKSFSHILRTLRLLRGNLVMVNMNSKIQDSFKLLGFDGCFPVAESTIEAIGIARKKLL